VELVDTGTPNEQDHAYGVFTEERLRLLNARLEQSSSFDKLLTTLSVTAFGFSVGYIELIRPSPVNCPSWLLASWACLFASLLAVLVSFLTSQRACTRQVDITEQVLLSDSRTPTDSVPRNGWAFATAALNMTSFLSLIVGMAFLGMFAIRNLPK